MSEVYTPVGYSASQDVKVGTAVWYADAEFGFWGRGTAVKEVASGWIVSLTAPEGEQYRCSHYASLLDQTGEAAAQHVVPHDGVFANRSSYPVRRAKDDRVSLMLCPLEVNLVREAQIARAQAWRTLDVTSCDARTSRDVADKFAIGLVSRSPTIYAFEMTEFKSPSEALWLLNNASAYPRCPGLADTRAVFVLYSKYDDWCYFITQAPPLPTPTDTSASAAASSTSSSSSSSTSSSSSSSSASSSASSAPSSSSSSSSSSSAKLARPKNSRKRKTAAASDATDASGKKDPNAPKRQRRGAVPGPSSSSVEVAPVWTSAHLVCTWGMWAAIRDDMPSTCIRRWHLRGAAAPMFPAPSTIASVSSSSPTKAFEAYKALEAYKLATKQL